MIVVHVKAREIPDDADLTADVAIIGAGPIGIVCALELANAGIKVTLVESGGFRYDKRAQRLSIPDSSQDDYYHADSLISVRRQLGGTSALWGGRCVPFDPIDFESRPAVPDALWPVGYEEISSYFARTCGWFRCGRPEFNASDIFELKDQGLVPGLKDADVKATDLERWSLPTRFGSEFGDEVRHHRNITLITNMTCTEIVRSHELPEIQYLVLRAAPAHRATLCARKYIIATGGLEATRLLLASNRVGGRSLGDHSGHLGRWYMAHVEARVAEVHFTTDPKRTIYDYERDSDGVYLRRRFTLTRDFQLRTNVPNSAVWLVNPELANAGHGSGILSGVYLVLRSPVGRFLLAEAIRQSGIKTKDPTTIWAHCLNIIKDIGPAVRFASVFPYERFLRPGRKAPGFFVRSAMNTYPLHYHGEHLPNWNSRVELGTDRDALGLHRLRTKLHFSSEDVRGVERTLDKIDQHLRYSNVGYIRYTVPDIESEVYSYLEANAGYHQTGTTRMAATPRGGVVDRNLAVFGFSNVHIASTSVFPTSSQANPTFMGVAFGLRLVDYIRSVL